MTGSPRNPPPALQDFLMHTAAVKNQIKTMFNLMLDYALEYELVDKNFSRTFNLSDEVIKEIVNPKNEHITFTDEEMDLLWQHVGDDALIDVLLVQCYSGWRPQEIGLIEIANVDLENGTFKGGIKTDAGKDRTHKQRSPERDTFWISGSDDTLRRSCIY